MRRIDRRERRRIAAAKAAPSTAPAHSVFAPAGASRTLLHEDRLDTVIRVLRESGAGRVLDLGCGAGALLRRLLLEPQFTEIVGVDSSAEALRVAGESLEGSAECPVDRVSLVHGSVTDADPRLAGFEAAAMVEVIEHVPPRQLSLVERTVFAAWRPALVVLTTPNQEYNVMYRLEEGGRRHPDHRFECCRMKFPAWAGGVADRNGYALECVDIRPAHPLLGSPTQMGVFRRRAG